MPDKIDIETHMAILRDRIKLLDAQYNHFCKYERHRNPAMFDLILKLKYEAEIKLEKYETENSGSN